TYFNEKSVDSRKCEIDDFIADMPANTQKIIIPMNLPAEGKSNEGLHWNLLVYDIRDY
ncbi:hypothetical protein MKX03_017170, partial [Papaver bracteatum]